MRVTFIRNNFEDINVSMAIYADALGDALTKTDPDIDLRNVSPRSSIARFLTGSSSSFARLRNYWERFCIYPKLVKSLDSDIFHILDHSFSYLLNYISGSKTVVTCHDLILLKTALGHFGKVKAPRFAHYLFKSSLSHIGKAERIIAVSSSTKRDIEELLGIDPSKVVQIHQGIDVRFFSGRGKAGLRDPKMGYRILHIGGDLFYKNMEGIIRSLSMLNKGIRGSVTLVKIGGFNRASKKLMSDLGLAEQLELHKNVPKEELPGVYRSCDLLLFPSLYEGFGAPPLEAMGCGVPVIVSDRGSLPEICGDAVVYVDPLNPKMMAEAVESVLTDTNLREKLIAKGLDRVKLFDWQSTAKKTFNLYQSLLG